MQSSSTLLVGAFLAVAGATSVNSATPTGSAPSTTPTTSSCASSCSIVPATRFLSRYHCQDPGTINTPRLLSNFQSTSGDYTSCYASCWSSDTCVSFSYNTATQSCELYSKTVVGQSFTSDPSSTQSFWNIRGCFGMPTLACTDSTPPSVTASSTSSATPTPSLTCAGAIDFPSDLSAPFLLQWALNSASQPVYVLLGLGTVQYNVPSYAISTTTKYTSGSTTAVYTLDSTTGLIDNGLFAADFTTSVFTPSSDVSRVQFQSQRYYGTLDSSKFLTWTYNDMNGLLSLGGTSSQQYTPIYCETPAVNGQDINIIKTGTAMPNGCVAACPAAVVPAKQQIFSRRGMKL